MFFDEYYLLEYIESSGTQYIDTGVALSIANTHKFEFGGTITANNAGHIYGNGYGIWRTPSGKWSATADNGGQGESTFQSSIYTDVGWTITSGSSKTSTVTYTQNGSQETKTRTGITITSFSHNCYIFWADTAYSKVIGKIYYFKIYVNNVLVRNFVPAKRKSDNVLGLYDLVNNAFYTNAGTGTFTAGHIVDVSVNPIGSGTIGIETSGNNTILTANANAGYEFENWTLDGYTQLEYIQSSGTQYIDTGIIATPTTQVLIEASMLTKGSYNVNHLFGAGSSTSGEGFGSNDFLFGQANQSYYYRAGSSATTHGTGDTNQHIFNVYANGRFSVDETEYTSTSVLTGQGTKSMFLFRSNIINYGGYTGNNKINYCKIYDSNSLVRDFIPVIRHSDAQIGLLDLVNLKFYGNSGTGSFIGGDPV